MLVLHPGRSRPMMAHCVNGHSSGSPLGDDPNAGLACRLPASSGRTTDADRDTAAMPQTEFSTFQPCFLAAPERCHRHLLSIGNELQRIVKDL